MAVARINRTWLRTIRDCLEQTVKQTRAGQSDTFTRATINLGLFQRYGPPLTPLVEWGVLEQAWVDTKGTPFYRLRDPAGVERALRELRAL